MHFTKKLSNKLKDFKILLQGIGAGINLIKLSADSSKNSFKLVYKYELISEILTRTFDFINVIVLGILINEIIAGAPKHMLFLYLGILMISQFLKDSIPNFFDFRVDYNNLVNEKYLDQSIIEKYKSIDLKTRSNPEFIKIEKTVRDDLWKISLFMSQVSMLIGSIYTIILSFTAITTIDYRILSIVLAAGLISFYLKSMHVIKIYKRREQNIYHRKLKSIPAENFYRNEVSNLYDNIVINRNYDFIKKTFDKGWENFLSFKKRLLQDTESLRLNSNYVYNLASALTVGIVYYQGIEGLIQFGTLTIIISAYNSLSSDIDSLSSRSSRIIEWFQSVQNYQNFVNFKSEERSFQKVNIWEDFEIEFKNVSFKYPNTEEYSLKNINLTIKKGDKLGVIGENGAGKSTLIRLLYRIYEPTEGVILFNGQNIQDLRDEEYFKLFKCLPQDQYLENDLTINELIYLGDTQQEMDKSKIKWSAQMSDADVFIQKLPNGYDQKILSHQSFMNSLQEFSEEKYHLLSPGQKMRVLVARVFYSCAEVVILDEPTSNVDPITTKNIFENLKELRNNQILILISHDILRLNNAVNKILILKEGQIAEYGERSELLQNKNSLYNQTFSSYDTQDLRIERS